MARMLANKPIQCHDRPRVFAKDPIKIPMWVQSIVKEKTGCRDYHAHFVVKKPLTATDRDRYQNRLLIPTESVKNNLFPFLTDEEKRLVGFLPDDNNEINNNENKNNDGKRGMKVGVFDKTGSEFSDIKLAYWTSSQACVVKGKDYKHMRSLRNDPKVMVEVWCFRKPKIDLELRLKQPEQESPSLYFIIGRCDDNMDESSSLNNV